MTNLERYERYLLKAKAFNLNQFVFRALPNDRVALVKIIMNRLTEDCEITIPSFVTDIGQDDFSDSIDRGTSGWGNRSYSYGSSDITIFSGYNHRLNKLKVIFHPTEMVDAYKIFYGFPGTYLDLSEFDLTKIKSIRKTFCGSSSLRTLILGSKFDVSGRDDLSSMFGDCASLEEIVYAKPFDLSTAKNISYMFSGCQNLKDISIICNSDTSSVEDMAHLCYNCNSIEKVSFGGRFSTDKCRSLQGAFSKCTELKYASFLCDFRLRFGININSLFADCVNLEELVFSKEFREPYSEFSGVLKNCSNLKTIRVGQSENILRMAGRAHKNKIITY